jgi:hypothetical protein
MTVTQSLLVSSPMQLGQEDNLLANLLSGQLECIFGLGKYRASMQV